MGRLFCQIHNRPRNGILFDPVVDESQRSTIVLPIPISLRPLRTESVTQLPAVLRSWSPISMCIRRFRHEPIPGLEADTSHMVFQLASMSLKERVVSFHRCDSSFTSF